MSGDTSVDMTFEFATWIRTRSFRRFATTTYMKSFPVAHEFEKRVSAVCSEAQPQELEGDEQQGQDQPSEAREEEKPKNQNDGDFFPTVTVSTRCQAQNAHNSNWTGDAWEERENKRVEEEGFDQHSLCLAAFAFVAIGALLLAIASAPRTVWLLWLLLLLVLSGCSSGVG